MDMDIDMDVDVDIDMDMDVDMDIDIDMDHAPQHCINIYKADGQAGRQTYPRYR